MIRNQKTLFQNGKEPENSVKLLQKLDLFWRSFK